MTAALAALVAALVGAAPAERFALVVGANDGGADRPALRWAVRDAERVAEVLGQLGDVPAARQTLLREPSAAELDAALALATGSIVLAKARGAARTELVFYYSGHADPAGLLLGAERFPYARLREALAAVPADVEVVVLDACASGAMLRHKGGVPVRSFLDAGPVASGHAWLASAAADEVAQESDRLEASFFTHHFVAGLRGAADRSGDRRVTLVEAYEHAFAETLAGTALTASGPQHPSYDIALAGEGDLVLTELAGASRLVLDASLAGRVFVRDRAGRLVAEVDKKDGDEVHLALAPGPHQVALVVGRRVLAATVELAAAPITVSRAALADRGPALEARERGGVLLVDALPRAERTTALRISLVPLLGFEGDGDDLAVDGLALALLADVVLAVRGAQLAGIYAEAGAVTGLQLAPVAVAGVVRGSQVGLITYAERVEGVAVALFPWVDEGVHALETWLDTRGDLGLGYRLGPRHLYVQGLVAFAPLAGDAADACDGATIGLGVGSRVALGPLDLDLDLGVRIPAPGCRGEAELVPRVSLGWRFVPELGVYVGGGLAGAASGEGAGFLTLGVRAEVP